jgi:hypothetical protein
MRITIHPNPALLTFNLIRPACAGNNASISISVTSGSAPFDIFFDGAQVLDNINTFPQQLVVPADGNNHLIKVIDAKGCETTGTVNGGTAPAPIIFTLTPKAQTCLDVNDGCITVTISGGTPPYKVQLNNGALVQLAANETFSSILRSGSGHLHCSCNGCKQLYCCRSANNSERRSGLRSPSYLDIVLTHRVSMEHLMDRLVCLMAHQYWQKLS